MAIGRPLDIPSELLEAFRHSGAVTGYLVSILPNTVWRVDPPSGRGRTIAAIVAHIQSVRRTFARMGGARPAGVSLDRRRVTQAQTQAAISASTRGLAKVFSAAFEDGRARVKGQPRRAVDMLTYLIQHDAHHRGQIGGLARDLGHQFTTADIMRLWGWKKLPDSPGGVAGGKAGR